MDSRMLGRHFTEVNPFQHQAFMEWSERCCLPRTRILEPFAGGNYLIDYLESVGLCQSSKSFDLHPSSERVEQRDTIESFPTGFDVCVTNPPWLAKNMATQNGLDFPDDNHDNIYKVAMDKILDNVQWVAALLPGSFLRSNMFRERLTDFISINRKLFDDTNHPVGLALFQPDKSSITRIWDDSEYVGDLAYFEKITPKPHTYGPHVVFNQMDGNVGLYGVDNPTNQSIRFCLPNEVECSRVKPTGRHITRIYVEGAIRIDDWNMTLNEYRKKTRDILMLPTYELRKDGKYRRRLDFELARGIIHDDLQPNLFE